MRLTHFNILLFSICLLLGTASHAAAKTTTPTLVVLGDSISAAYGINSHQGWVQLLQQRLNDQGYRYRVINASISGDTSHSGLSRLPALLKQHQPKILIIALGGNDGLQGLPLTALKNNLSQIIEKSRQYLSQPLLIGIRLPPNYGADYNRRFASLYQQLANEDNIPLIPRLMDNVADNKQLMQADGIHPTAAAQMQLLENIWPSLIPLL